MVDKYSIKSPMGKTYEMDLSKDASIISIIYKIRNIESPHVENDLYLKTVKAICQSLSLDKNKEIKRYPIIIATKSIQITFEDSAANSNFNLYTFATTCPLTHNSIKQRSSVHDQCGFLFEEEALMSWEVNHYDSDILCPVCSTRQLIKKKKKQTKL